MRAIHFEFSQPHSEWNTAACRPCLFVLVLCSSLLRLLAVGSGRVMMAGSGGGGMQGWRMS